MRKRRVTSGRRSIQVAGTNGDYGSSVLLNGVDRQLDQYLQTQLRTETSGAAYADIRSTFLANLQNVYGNPAETGTIEDAFNKLLTALPGPVDQSGLAVGADRCASTPRRRMAQTAQRDDARHSEPSRQGRNGDQDSVVTANNAMHQIAIINNQLQRSGNTSDAAAAALKDQRDQYITQRVVD